MANGPAPLTRRAKGRKHQRHPNYGFRITPFFLLFFPSAPAIPRTSTQTPSSRLFHRHNQKQESIEIKKTTLIVLRHNNTWKYFVAQEIKSSPKMASWSLKKMMEKKMLQFDVTFGMYMFTPMEKFFFCTSSPPSFSSPPYPAFLSQIPPIPGLMDSILFSRSPLLGQRCGTMRLRQSRQQITNL